MSDEKIYDCLHITFKLDEFEKWLDTIWGRSGKDWRKLKYRLNRGTIEQYEACVSDYYHIENENIKKCISGNIYLDHINLINKNKKSVKKQ